MKASNTSSLHYIDLILACFPSF